VDVQGALHGRGVGHVDEEGGVKGHGRGAAHHRHGGSAQGIGGGVGGGGEEHGGAEHGGWGVGGWSAGEEQGHRAVSAFNGHIASPLQPIPGAPQHVTGMEGRQRERPNASRGAWARERPPRWDQRHGGWASDRGLASRGGNQGRGGMEKAWHEGRGWQQGRTIAVRRKHVSYPAKVASPPPLSLSKDLTRQSNQILKRRDAQQPVLPAQMSVCGVSGRGQ
jgi:hypothetical protein